MFAPQAELQRRVIYSGRVQGVGFRYTTTTIASSYAVVGYVRNLADGTVELVAEGARGELKAFLAAIMERLGDKISSTAVDEAPASGQFGSFEVRF